MPEDVMTDAFRTAEAPPVSFRLHRLAAPDYKVVFESKRTAYAHSLAMWVAVLPDADRRVGVVVSKRVFRKAHDRSRAKRLLREAFRLMRPRLKPGVSVILVPRAGIAGKKCKDVMRDFERACKRAKIWKPVASG